MNTDNYIVINSSDINLLQLSLRNYIQENPAVDRKGKASDVLRKLYSIQVCLNNSSNEELYIFKNEIR